MFGSKGGNYVDLLFALVSWFLHSALSAPFFILALKTSCKMSAHPPLFATLFTHLALQGSLMTSGQISSPSADRGGTCVNENNSFLTLSLHLLPHFFKITLKDWIPFNK